MSRSERKIYGHYGFMMQAKTMPTCWLSVKSVFFIFGAQYKYTGIPLAPGYGYWVHDIACVHCLTRDIPVPTNYTHRYSPLLKQYQSKLMHRQTAKFLYMLICMSTETVHEVQYLPELLMLKS